MRSQAFEQIIARLFTQSFEARQVTLVASLNEGHNMCPTSDICAGRCQFPTQPVKLSQFGAENADFSRSFHHLFSYAFDLLCHFISTPPLTL